MIFQLFKKSPGQKADEEKKRLSALNDQFISAVCDGNYKDFMKAVKNGADINFLDINFNHSALWYLAFHLKDLDAEARKTDGRWQIFSALLQMHGLDVKKTKDYDGMMQLFRTRSDRIHNLVDKYNPEKPYTAELINAVLEAALPALPTEFTKKKADEKRNKPSSINRKIPLPEEAENLLYALKEAVFSPENNRELLDESYRVVLQNAALFCGNKAPKVIKQNFTGILAEYYHQLSDLSLEHAQGKDVISTTETAFRETQAKLEILHATEKNRVRTWGEYLGIS